MQAKINSCQQRYQNVGFAIIRPKREASMANLSIRKIDHATLQALRLQAASHGVSMEEEVRQILKQAVAATEKPGDLAVRLFSPAWGTEALPLPPREVHEPLDFNVGQGTTVA